jgi:hypothetical protein
MTRMINLTHTFPEFSEFLNELEFIYNESDELWLKDDGEIFFTVGICDGKIFAMMTNIKDEFEEIQTDNFKKFKEWIYNKYER